MKVRRSRSWAVIVLFFAVLGFWGYSTVRETVPEGLMVGTRAPDFQLPDLDGRVIALSDFSGTPVLLRFSSRTCSYCYDDFDTLERLQREYEGRLQVVAIEIGAPADMVRAAVRGRNRSYPVLVDPSGAVADRYRLGSLPQLYWLDRAGRFVSRVSGELDDVNWLPHLQQALNPDASVFARVEEEVRAISQMIRCQECQGLSIWESQTASALEMQQDIRAMVESGMTRDEILDDFVNRYGVWILMVPPARGVFLWVYVTPFVFLALGGLLIRSVLRLRGQSRESDDAGPSVDPEAEAKVKERLKEFL